MPEKLVIMGSYAFAEEVASVVEADERFSLVAFIENQDRSRSGQELLGRPVIWIDDAAPYATDCAAICSIGTTHRRGFIQQMSELGFRFATVIHPSAQIFNTAEVGPGSLISAGVIIAAGARIGQHVIINRGCLIGHHTHIGDFCTISPGANIGGRISIGEGAYVAMGSIIINDLKIGSGSVVGAGAVVTRDVPDRVQVMGIPAKITQENIQGR